MPSKNETAKFKSDFAENFRNLAAAGKLSHAYLFFGGGNSSLAKKEKFAFAESLANFLERGVFEKPEKPLLELSVVEKNEKETVGIDAVRDLKNFLYRKPIVSKRRTAIIKDAENLTPEAQNAILKIAEEPPDYSLIIFIASDETNLLPTLKSRLHKVYFPRPAEIGDLKGKGKIAKNVSAEEILENDRLDDFFEALIAEFGKNPAENGEKLKEILKRLVLIKQYNVNKRLQLKALLRTINL